jgi:hypothetical protein
VTMILGIVTEVAIIYYSDFQELGEPDNRFITAQSANEAEGST